MICLMIAAIAGSCGSESKIPLGNITNYGYILVEGNDIYYTKVIITDLSYYSNIYKYNTATKSEIVVAEIEVDYLNEMNAYLTLYNGELYFLPYFLHDSMNESSPNIYKVKPDGENIVPTALLKNEISCTFMQIKDGVLYYYDDIDGKLYSMKPDGTNRKVICEAVMDSISIEGSKAYFAEDELLMSVSLKGGEPAEIFDFFELDEGFFLKDIIADGNYIYYADDEYARVGRIRTNGKNNEIIYTAESGEYINFFNVSGDTVFMVVENYGTTKAYAILSVSAKGKEPRVVVSETENFGDILPISIWGDTIYLNAMPIYDTVLDSDYVWFTAKKTGSKPIPFKPFNVYDEFYDAEDDDWGNEDEDDDDEEDDDDDWWNHWDDEEDDEEES
jgi:hypothetical protein